MKTKKTKPISKIVKPIGGLHGISAIFPNFEDVINYEENKIELNRGYPRFVTHPFVRKHENLYKKKFKAFDVICCQSYESAIFLILDYYIKKGIKISVNDVISREFFKYFKRKFPEFIFSTPNHEADIIITDTKDLSIEHKAKDQVLILIVKNSTKISIENENSIDIIITQDNLHDIGIIIFYTDTASDLILLRRHTGLIASSRKISTKKPISNKNFTQKSEMLKTVISKLEFTSSDNCFLFPSGMAAVFYAIYSLLSPKKSRFIALGSLYVDTIRILEKWPKKYGLKDTLFITEEYERNLKISIDENTAGIILEFPSNPLIQLIDLEKIVKIAHEKKIKIIVDNTIATPFNFNPFNYNVDIIVHSTTKFLNGKNNHIGGVLLTKNDNIKKEVSNLKHLSNLTMDFNDIKILSRNLKYFEKRMQKINTNSILIANFLYNHLGIEKIYYPFINKSPNYKLAKKYLKGGSGLISFVLKKSSYEIAERFYNNILPPILKGPSLGSEKTLISPYVIMAHYNDSKETLKKMGFDFYLMRISVGIEPVNKIIESLDHALKFILD